MTKTRYRILNKKLIFAKGPVCLMDCQVQRADGKVLNRQILEHPGCVVIIPRSSAGKYVLVRQYRYPIAKYLWEFPAGGRELGETLGSAARRELTEEIHYYPKRLKKLAAFYPTPGVSGEKMHLYLASDLVRKVGRKDEDEEFEIREFELSEIGRMIEKGKIIDGKTIVGFFYLKNLKNL